MSSAYLRLLIFLPAILILACTSSSPAFLMMYSAYKLNKQGDNIQPWCTPFPIWNQSIVPYPVLTFVSWPAYRFLSNWDKRHTLCPYRFQVISVVTLKLKHQGQILDLKWLYGLRNEYLPVSEDWTFVLLSYELSQCLGKPYLDKMLTSKPPSPLSSPPPVWLHSFLVLLLMRFKCQFLSFCTQENKCNLSLFE